MTELVHLYNQTRSDYLIPMPMNAVQLEQYIELYQVNLDDSWVAWMNGAPAGIAMMGVRTGRTWFTRLGVCPEFRRSGAGEQLMLKLLKTTHELGISTAYLEVIQGNRSAERLFQRLGFQPLQSLAVLEGPVEIDYLKNSGDAGISSSGGTFEWLTADAALRCIATFPGRQAWTNQLETYRHAEGVKVLHCNSSQSGEAWLAFIDHGEYRSHYLFHCNSEDVEQAAWLALDQFHRSLPNQPARVENVSSGSPFDLALRKFGYQEKFLRTEMVWSSTD